MRAQDYMSLFYNENDNIINDDKSKGEHHTPQARDNICYITAKVGY